MAYSKETPNFQLPQYDPNDKPKYLSDFNKAMEIIDTAIKENEDNITGLSSNIDNISSTANSANNTATEAKEKADSVSSNAENALNTAQSAEEKATTNLDILKSFFEGFNNIENW